MGFVPSCFDIFFNFSGHGECIVVTNDNKYFIAGFSDKSIRVFDLETKQLVHHFENAHESKFFFVGLIIHLPI